MVLISFHLDPLGIAGKEDASSHFCGAINGQISLQFIDCRPLEIAGYSHDFSYGRNKNDIPGQEPHIPRAVPIKQKVIHVQGAGKLTVPFETDFSEASHFVRPSRGGEGVSNSCIGADRISAGPFDISNNIYDDASQPAEGNTGLAAYQFGFNLMPQKFPELRKCESRHIQNAYIWKVDTAFPVDREIVALVDPSPDGDIDFITRSDNIVIRNRQIRFGFQDHCGILEKVISELADIHGHLAGSAAGNEALDD